MAVNASGRPNRVAPDGSLHAVADRGMWWGNRGRLLDGSGAVTRHSSTRAWLICRLEFHGRHRTQWRPDRMTELYFLDEVTGLAAGHRPCGECRHADYQLFKAAFARAFPDDAVGATHLDRRLAGERASARSARVHTAASNTLPDGAIVQFDEGWWLLRGPHLHEWTFGGYAGVRPRAELPAVVTVQTPRPTIDVLRAGYAPSVHPSVDRGH